VWPLHALGVMGYPGGPHRQLMMQGFEQCFVLGFLLTAMPAFTHGERCRPWELAWAAAAMLLLGAATFGGVEWLAHVAFLASLLLIVVAGGRRVFGNPQKPPEEFLFVGFGVLLGMTGGAALLAAALGSDAELPWRFADRLLSLGMVLSLVVGVGSLLVPTFAGMRDPLTIPGVAGPHQRRGRRLLYVAVIAAFALAFGAELAGRVQLGAIVRSVAVTVMGLWVWKLTRLPRRDVPGFALWTSGWMVMTGLWVAACFPRFVLAGMHVAFIGGFALLTMGVGTRVVVAHGGQPLDIERRILDPFVAALMLLALGARLAAEFAPAYASQAWAAAGALWIAAWILWGLRVMTLTGRNRAPNRG
jgi:uncharacterized protein involved in response to NO